jgi:hypothetical protein
MREKNIFYHLVRNETSLTEVFCNLMQYKVFRDNFLRFIQDKTQNLDIDVDKILYDNFDTEETFKIKNNDKEIEEKNAGRGDLVLTTNQNIKYIFELKIEVNTRLTKNQPNRYLDYLKENDNNNFEKQLFFILPRGYWHTNEILKRDNRVCQKNILYWEDIIENIRKNELDKANLFIDEFCKILDNRWFYFEKITFTKNELQFLIDNKETKMDNITVPQMMQKLFKIVNGVKIDCDNTINRQNYDWFGYVVDNKKNNIKSKNNYQIWFGIEYDIWEKDKYPLTIQVSLYKDNENDLEKISKLTLDDKPIVKYENTNEDNDAGELYYFPLDNNLFELDDGDIISKFTEKVQKVIEAVSKI